MTHPLYARPLVNRNPAQTNRNYVPGRDAWVAEPMDAGDGRSAHGHAPAAVRGGDAAAAGGGVEHGLPWQTRWPRRMKSGPCLERKAAALKERSAPKLLELLEAEFVYVTASGRRLRRDAYVENGTGPHGLRFQSQEIEGLDVADFGDVAIATMILHDRFESQGQAVPGPTGRFACFAGTAPLGCGQAGKRASQVARQTLLDYSAENGPHGLARSGPRSCAPEGIAALSAKQPVRPRVLLAEQTRRCTHGRKRKTDHRHRRRNWRSGGCPGASAPRFQGRRLRTRTGDSRDRGGGGHRAERAPRPARSRRRRRPRGPVLLGVGPPYLRLQDGRDRPDEPQRADHRTARHGSPAGPSRRPARAADGGGARQRSGGVVRPATSSSASIRTRRACPSASPTAPTVGRTS